MYILLVVSLHLLCEHSVHGLVVGDHGSGVGGVDSEVGNVGVFSVVAFVWIGGKSSMAPVVLLHLAVSVAAITIQSVSMGRENTIITGVKSKTVILW